MRLFLLLGLGALAAQPALAQNAAQRQAEAVVRNGDALLLNTAGQGAGWHYQPSGDVRCLRETKTRREVCRTRAQWTEIARRIEAGLPWRD